MRFPSSKNRRVDVSLSTGQESLRYYPFKAEDYRQHYAREIGC